MKTLDLIATQEVYAGRAARPPAKPTQAGNRVGVSVGISAGCSTGRQETRTTESSTCKPNGGGCTTTTTTETTSTKPSCSIGVSGGGAGGASRVICTHFYKKGMLPQEVWRADMAFTFKNLSPTTVKGYHFWAIPYVKLMRRSTVAEKIMHPLALWRAEELAYQMGVLQKGNFKGKMVRWVGEPICFAIGLFSKQGNWAQLWENEKLIEKQAAI